MRTPETRRSLIAQLQVGRNEVAWTEFVSSYEPFLQRLVQRQGTPSGHVPDVTQLVFAVISGSVKGWEDDGEPASFRRWVHRIARNVVIKYMTRERRTPRGQGGTDLLEVLKNIPDSPSDQEQEAYEIELIQWAAGEVREEFRETSWKAFWETLVAGRSVESVARELNVSPGSIYMSRSRIMARIRAKVREINSEDVRN